MVIQKRLPFVMALLLALVPFLSVSKADAALLRDRSVRLTNSVAGEISSYDFDFDIQTVASLGSIEFEFCENSPLVGNPCTAPVGFDASSVTLTSQSGQTGFSIDGSSTANRILLSRAPSLSSAVPVSYVFGNITNPTDTKTVYVRLATFATIDGSGGWTDEGGLAFSTARQLTVESYVPPYLTFCVGVTVAGDCSSANGSLLNFGELSTIQPKFLSSQFAAATNDFTGYSVTVGGITMASGTNVIPALTTPTGSVPGTSQFGMNLRANSNPGVGSNPSGIGFATVSSDFGSTNQFVFKNAVVASSTTSTDFNLFTASYLVNVSSSQKPGIYNTTLTYTATASF